MKRILPIVITVIMFIAGVTVCLYPNIATYINQKNEASVIEQMNEAANKISKEELEEQKKAIRAYNHSLNETRIVLTDPFDPDAFPITDGNYKELLSMTDAMASVEIPRINVKLSIYHTTNEDVLRKGVGHLENTSLPLGGESTHAIFSAHTGLPSLKLFSDLDQMEEGDIFFIYVLDEKLSYKVDQIKVVEPSDATDLMIVPGEDHVTLLTCTPYGKNTHRLLVRGVRQPNPEAEKAVEEQINHLSFFEYMQMKYGLSVRDLIVFSCVFGLSLLFLGVFFFTGVIKKKGGRNNHEKFNS